MCRDKLVDIFREKQIANLRSSVDPVNLLSSKRVEEANRAVGSTASRGK